MLFQNSPYHGRINGIIGMYQSVTKSNNFTGIIKTFFRMQNFKLIYCFTDNPQLPFNRTLCLEITHVICVTVYGFRKIFNYTIA